MSLRIALLRAKLKLSLKTVVWLFARWRYAVLAIVAAVGFFELIYWLFNYELAVLLFTNPSIGLVKKIEVFISPLMTISNQNGVIATVEMWIIAIVQGINIALLTYVLRHQRKVDAGAVGGTSFVGLLAIIGLGCPACGTSLVTPIVAIFASSTAVAASESIVSFTSPLAILVGLYGVYSLGIKTANVRATISICMQ